MVGKRKGNPSKYKRGGEGGILFMDSFEDGIDRKRCNRKEGHVHQAREIHTQEAHKPFILQDAKIFDGRAWFASQGEGDHDGHEGAA
jgi:hypothetical protein